jgi:hypothetical protein
VATPSTCREVGQTWSFRGTKSRNKVTVGEPAVGSLLILGAKLIPQGVLSTESTFCALLLSFGLLLIELVTSESLTEGCRSKF